MNIGPGGMMQGGPPHMQGPQPMNAPSQMQVPPQMAGPPQIQGPQQMTGPPQIQGPPQMHPQMQGSVGSMQGPLPMQGPSQIQVQQEKFDNISKVKSLTAQLRESLANTLKTAALNVVQNNVIDSVSVKCTDAHAPRFDKQIEEFYGVCDQIELNLKTAIECHQQGTSSQRYLSVMVATTKTEPLPNQDANTLTYPQYLSTTRSQVSYAKDIHDMLTKVAHNITQQEPST